MHIHIHINFDTMSLNNTNTPSRPPLKENPASATSTAEPPLKKQKASEDVVLTFSLSHSPVHVQVLASQSVFQLVDVICKSTIIGRGESVNAHLWDVFLPGRNIVIHSPDNCATGRQSTETTLESLQLDLNSELKLKYDFGSTSYYGMKLVDRSVGSTKEEYDNYPRKKPLEEPAFSIYETTEVDLNQRFPHLNKFMRNTIHLFQPGRKKNFGLVEIGTGGCRQMVFMPAKPAHLSNYLHTLDYGCGRVRPARFRGSFFAYNWYSMVVFPSLATNYGKYGKCLESGSCDLEQSPQCTDTPSIAAIFPKVSALAGYRKDKKIPKGWVTYSNGILRICTGTSQTHSSKAPKGTAFDGLGQHEPTDPPLFQSEVIITSLHHLFCVVEGLLRTL